MSIRLRLTLFYSAILALTLIIFGATLYTIQSRYTLNSLRSDLILSSDGLSQAVLDKHPAPPDLGQHRPPPPPVPFDTFSNQPAFQRLPEREIVRLLDADGNVVASPFGRSEDALPFSAAGLQAVQDRQKWWETGYVNQEPLLIYSRPILSDGKLVYILQVARSLTERDRSLRTLGSTLIIASLLTTLAAFGIGWVLSGMALRPIQRITQTAQDIGNERDFTRRVSHTGRQDEIGQLATTFNTMLTHLQDAYQRVAHSLEMQRNFVADVSHELRTPLTTLRGNLGLLQRTPPLPAEEQADILNDMVDESDRLIRLVNDLLVLARADAGRSLAHEIVPIRLAAEEVCRQVRQLDPQRQIELDIPEQLAITGDRDAFKQVLLILLDNALKHSDGDIILAAEARGAQALVRVQDFGAGIPPETLQNVFNRFYRGNQDTLTQGFGLGLPIAKALVEGQDGTILMESELGKGSTISMHFPIAK